MTTLDPPDTPRRSVTATGKKGARGKPEFIVEQAGKQYPTTNPDFVPGQTSKQIDFAGRGAGGGVKVTAGGKSFDLSKEEYLGQFVTPNTMALDEALAQPQISPEQQQQINQVGKSVVVEDPLADQDEGLVGSAVNVGSGAAGAAAGAVAGLPFAPLTAGLSVPVGAALGGISGYLGKVSFSERQKVGNANKLYKQAKSNIGRIMTAVNNGSLSYAQAVIAFNEQKALIDTAERHIQFLTRNDLQKFLSGGYDELVTIRTWRDFNIPILENDMRNAALNPNPNAVYNFDEPDND